jgi:RNA polymerase sigma-B factor
MSGDHRTAACERAVREMAGMVRNIARRYETPALPAEDLAQVGYIGLIHAVDRFDPTRGVPLRAYAARMIEGEVLHAVRDQRWAVRVPRGLQESSHRVARVSEQLAQRLGRAPTEEEIADESGLPAEIVRESLVALQALTARGLATEQRPLDDEDIGDSGAVLAAVDPAFDDALARAELEDAMRSLPPRDRRVLGLRIYADLTQSEIAERVGVSQMHVSRILRRAGRVVRERLETTA